MQDVETILKALRTFDGYDAMLYDVKKGVIVRFQDVVDFVTWQNSEIEQLKQEISGYVADQEIWIGGYKGAQAENESLKAEIERLTEDNKRLNELLVGGTEVIDYWNNKYLEEQAKNTELQKQVDELKKQLNDMEEQRDRQAYIAEDLIQEKHRWTEQAVEDTAKEIYELIDSVKEVFPNDICGYEMANGWSMCVDKLKEIIKSKGVEVE
jgi:Fe2+ transport system protein B